MRCRGFWLPVLAVTLWASSAGSNAWGDEYWVETADWIPTSSVSILPTSYATSYILPTSFSAPTVYATAYAAESVLTPTSYVVPSYYETRFRRSIFGRRLIPSAIGRYRAVTGVGVASYTPTTYTPTTYYRPTSYFPTTLYYPSAYYVPTSYVVPTTYRTVGVIDREVVASEYVTETDACCGGSTSVALAAPRVVAPERSSPAQARRERQPAIQSEPESDYDEDPGLSSNVEPAPAPAPRPRSAAGNSGVRKPESAAASPPKPQTPDRVQSTERPDGEPLKQPASPAPAASDTNAPTPPAAPSGTEGLLEPEIIPDGPATTRSESRKPVYNTTRALPVESRNVLFGRVRERETREPEEGVRVMLTNRTRAFDDRIALTDAFGRFAVRVPDGDWTVKVTMPSGRVYSVSEITVSNGLISDDEGRDVPSLTITR